MITGVVIPTSGELKVNGKISSLLELGTAFNSELTGEENIYQHGQVMGLTKEEIEATKQDVIDFADIGEHLYQPVYYPLPNWKTPNVIFTDLHLPDQETISRNIQFFSNRKIEKKMKKMFYLRKY